MLVTIGALRVNHLNYQEGPLRHFVYFNHVKLLGLFLLYKE